MSFKDVLVALTTYPEPTPLPVVDDAIDLAGALGAQVFAIALLSRSFPTAPITSPRSIAVISEVTYSPRELLSPRSRFSCGLSPERLA
jgi:hypothetical protein